MSYATGSPESVAYALGREHGHSAATWEEIDDPDTARAILRGIEDGDPAIYDRLPSPDLSGEWAGSMTGPDLFRIACDESTDSLDPDDPDTFDALFMDVCDAYDTGFYEASEAEVVRMCQHVLLS